MSYRLLLFTICVACLTSIVDGQATKITRDEYFSQMSVADKKTESLFPRREVMVEEVFQKGKMDSRRTVTYEYTAKETNRHKVVETKAGVKARTEEYVQVGGNYFCKEGTSTWKKSGKRCEPMRMSMSPDPDQEEFTVENVSVDGNENRVYGWYKTWIPSLSPDATRYYSKQIFTVGSDGKLLKSYWEEGKVKTKEVDSTNTWNYEYGITISNIEPPIR